VRNGKTLRLAVGGYENLIGSVLSMADLMEEAADVLNICKGTGIENDG
jgi:hypothetical protein